MALAARAPHQALPLGVVVLVVRAGEELLSAGAPPLQRQRVLRADGEPGGQGPIGDQHDRAHLRRVRAHEATEARALVAVGAQELAHRAALAAFVARGPLGQLLTVGLRHRSGSSL